MEQPQQLGAEPVDAAERGERNRAEPALGEERAHRIVVTGGASDKVLRQRQHMTGRGQRKAESVHHADRHHDERRIRERIGRAIERHIGMAIPHDQHLHRPVMPVRRYRPVVQHAAFRDRLDMAKACRAVPRIFAV